MFYFFQKKNIFSRKTEKSFDNLYLDVDDSRLAGRKERVPFLSIKYKYELYFMLRVNVLVQVEFFCSQSDHYVLDIVLNVVNMTINYV